MSDDTTLRLPVPDETFDKGPALCMDISGVIAPFSVSTRPFVRHRTPDGFIKVYGYDYFEYMDHWRFVHPALPDWIGELEAAFTHCAWLDCITSHSTIYMPRGGGQAGKTEWPHLRYRDDVDSQAPGYYKTSHVSQWVAPDVPVALVDIHLPPPDSDHPEYQAMWQGLVRFLERQGPTLLISPFPSIGLSRSVVDLLCRFAGAPHDPAFAGRIHRPHLDPYLSWPNPLPSWLEEPVLVLKREEPA